MAIQQLSIEIPALTTAHPWLTDFPNTLSPVPPHILIVPSSDVVTIHFPSREYSVDETECSCTYEFLWIGFNVFESQMVIVLSDELVMNVSPDRWKSIDEMRPEWASGELSSFDPDSTSQTMMEWSSDPEMNRRPSGAYLTVQTESEWASNRPRTLAPVEVSQT